MSEQKNPSYEWYMRGMAMQAEGATGDEIAKALGLINARAWYSTRTYHSSRRLAERALDLAEDKPEPAAILADIDCERSAPRKTGQPAKQAGQQVPPHQSHQMNANPERLMSDAERIEWGKRSNTHDLAGPKGSGTMTKAPRMNIRRIAAAEGEVVRYRVEDGVVRLNTLGQKRAALALYPDECRVMMRELAAFLEEVGV